MCPFSERYRGLGRCDGLSVADHIEFAVLDEEPQASHGTRCQGTAAFAIAPDEIESVDGIDTGPSFHSERSAGLHG